MPTQAFDTTMIYPISNQISRKRVGGTGGTREVRRYKEAERPITQNIKGKSD